MDLTHIIASRLNLRAVDLDEKTSAELLEILINVIDNITRNARQCINNKEITDESVKGVMRNHIVRTDAATNLSRANVISNVVSFLQTHKCDLLPSASWDDWVVALEAGEKEVIYSLLHWVLINSRELTNRCYLAPFLIPVEVPEVLLNDDNLYDLVESYKELQHDFVEIHKAFESLKESKALTIPELSAEIDRVDLEKKQLLDILQRDKSSNQKFQELLAETSLMRESEELTLRLEQQKIDQMAHSEAAKKRVKDAWRLLEAMKRNATSVDHCIAELEKKSQKAVLHLESQLIPQRLKLEAMIAKAEKDASTVRMGGDEEENSVYKTENARLRIALDEIIETSGINMSEDDFQELQSSLQEKLRLYQSESEKLSIAQQQLLALEGNKKELTERLQVVEKILQQQEEKGEITGFREVHRQLGHTFQETCVLNEVKCATLDEMSAIVSNIAVTLDGKRETLEPKVSMHILIKAKPKMHVHLLPFTHCLHPLHIPRLPS